MSSWVFASHQRRAPLSNLSEASWILVSSSSILCIFQYTLSWRTQLSNILASTSPSYIGKSNLMWSFKNGVLPWHFEECGGVCEGLVVEEDDGEDGGEDGGEENGGVKGGLSPFPLPFGGFLHLLLLILKTYLPLEYWSSHLAPLCFSLHIELSPFLSYQRMISWRLFHPPIYCQDLFHVIIEASTAIWGRICGEDCGKFALLVLDLTWGLATIRFPSPLLSFNLVSIKNTFKQLNPHNNKENQSSDTKLDLYEILMKMCLRVCKL